MLNSPQPCAGGPDRHPPGSGRGHPTALDLLLAGHAPTDIHWGLERIRSVLRALGDPHRHYKSIHVGGTNGKGSVAVTVATVLQRAGLRVGLYTSPHLVRFAERIGVDGRPAPAVLLEQCAAEVLPLARDARMSFFEAATALAFLAFARAAVDIAVVEVGLGGRLDATNVVQPEVTMITSVALDHSEHLGDTLVKIAGEKAGIVKPGVPVAVGPIEDHLLRVFQDRAIEVDAPLVALGQAAVVGAVRTGLDGTRFVYRSAAHPGGLSLRTPLIGEHQAANAGLALLGLEQTGLAVERVVLREAVASIGWPGRFQVLDRDDGRWILDMAHNAAGAISVAQTVQQLPVARPLVSLLAILGDKAWGAMLEPLLRDAAAAVFTIAPSSPVERRWDPRAAAVAAAHHRVEVETDFDRALSRARELARAGTVLVTGSCHTVGDALARLAG